LDCFIENNKVFAQENPGLNEGLNEGGNHANI
jgi:hypothetical protein